MRRRKPPLSSVSLSWLSITAAFLYNISTTCCALSRITSTTTDMYQANKVFVGGLICNRDTLQRHLEQTYGSIQEVVIPAQMVNDDNEAPSVPSPSYAFVTFHNPQHAQTAIQHEEKQSSNVNYYHDIKPYRIEINPKKERRQRREQLDWNLKEKIAEKSTIILQLATSHVARMEELLKAKEINIVGSCETDSRSISLLGVTSSNCNANELQAWFQSLPFPLRGLNKVHAVNPLKSFTVSNCHDNNNSIDESISRSAIREVTGRIWREIVDLDNYDANSVRIRLNIFPRSLATRLFQEIEDNNHKDEYDSKDGDVKSLLLGVLSPTDFTHTLDLIDITTNTGRKYKQQQHCFLMESRPRENKNSDRKMNVNIAEDNIKLVNSEKEISRAYHKLQEAFFRYPRGLPSDASTKDTFVAWDCGAAPGGWTKFLLGEMSDLLVFSIDPASLSPVVLNHPRVRHLAMTVEDAMEQWDNSLVNVDDAEKKRNCLKKWTGSRIDVWVSDMCLHQMSSQVDLLLLAHEKKIVGPGTFFVLTLKCLVGHSKEAFDEQVAQQRKRLEDGAHCLDLETLHLFSNRSGERTLMGYFQ